MRARFLSLLAVHALIGMIADGASGELLAQQVHAVAHMVHLAKSDVANALTGHEKLLPINNCLDASHVLEFNRADRRESGVDPADPSCGAAKSQSAFITSLETRTPQIRCVMDVFWHIERNRHAMARHAHSRIFANVVNGYVGPDGLTSPYRLKLRDAGGQYSAISSDQGNVRGAIRFFQSVPLPVRDKHKADRGDGED